jgi:hypothetical protein
VSTEETTPGTVTAEAEKILAGITEATELVGAKRLKALELMAQARGMIDLAGRMLIEADLAGPALEALLATGERLTAAQEAITPVADVIARLDAERADLTARVANLDAVAGSDDVPLDDRITSRVRRVAMREEIEDLAARADMLRRSMLAPLQRDLGEAQRDADRAASAAAGLEAASEAPFTHPRATRTLGYQVWLGHHVMEILSGGDERHPGWPEAKRQAMSMLAASGLGQFIERRAILAERAGDPAAKAIAGSTQHLASGQTVISEPGRPAVVYESGRATAAQLREAPAAPQVDSTPGAVAMAQMWGNVQHATSSGLWQHP